VAHAVLSFEFSCSRLRDLNAGASLTDRTGVGYLYECSSSYLYK
jgi:hypothetical protein